jgi:hypothetical protein
VQINGRAKDGNLQDHDGGKGHPKIVHSNSGKTHGESPARAWQRLIDNSRETSFRNFNRIQRYIEKQKVVAAW